MAPVVSLSSPGTLVYTVFSLVSHLVVGGAVVGPGPRSHRAWSHLVTPGVWVAVPVGAFVLARLSEDGESLGNVVVRRIGLRVELRGLQDVVVNLHF